MKKLKIIGLALATMGFVVVGCKSESKTTSTDNKGKEEVKKEMDCSNITFEANIKPIFAERCTGCHGGPNPKHGIDLTNIEGAKAAVGHKLMCTITGGGESCPKMPPFGGPLADDQVATIDCWIKNGMK